MQPSDASGLRCRSPACPDAATRNADGPAAGGPLDSIHDEEGPTDGSRLLACLQAWAQHRAGRFHYRLRCSLADGQFPDARALGRSLRALSPPLPEDLTAALENGWPPPLRGLHRIELVPGIAWVTVAIAPDLPERRRRQGHAGTLPRISRGAAEAVVVGAGLAGCAMADALLRRGWRVTVIEAGARVGGAVAEIPLLAQHPALSPGNDRRSRLLLSALLTTRRLAERFGTSMSWCGRFQPMPLAEAEHRTASIPSSVARPVAASDATLHGVAGKEGIWFPVCAMARPLHWWQQVLQSPGVTLRLSQPVATVSRRDGRWHAIDPSGASITSAPAMILASQAQALTLASMPGMVTGPLRLSRVQVAVGSAPPAPAGAGPSRQGGLPTILGGSSYRLEDPGRHCVVGPLQPGRDSLSHHRISLPGLTIGDPAYVWRLGAPGERLLLRDSLPMIGAAPESDTILAGPGPYQRNDRLPLPRREALHLLTGLGGRGLLWSVLGAEIIAAALNGEPPLVEPDLEEAVDPARFLKRSLRRGVGARGASAGVDG